MPAKLPIIAAPSPCIYRKRATSLLSAIKKPWQVVYTIADLNGIQTAINEGLGITVLAKSSVPSGLHVLSNSESLPELGHVGVCLVNPQKVSSKAISLLTETITNEVANF